MIKQTQVNSLFLLNELQCEKVKTIHTPVYYAFVRPMLQMEQRSFFIDIINDLFVYFYFKEVPIVDSEKALTHLIRHFVLQTVCKTARFNRIKKHTVNNEEKALLMAVFTLNIFLQIYEEHCANLSTEEEVLFVNFISNSHELFNKTNDTYPRKLVLIETKMLKQIANFIEQQEELFIQLIQNNLKFIEHYNFVESSAFVISNTTKHQITQYTISNVVTVPIVKQRKISLIKFQAEIEHIQFSTQERLFSKRLFDYFKPLTKSENGKDVLAALLSLREQYKKNWPQYLCELYLHIAHCYYFSMNYSLASYYYRQAISYGLQFKNYKVVSVAVNKLTDCCVYTPEQTYSFSKLGVIFSDFEQSVKIPTYLTIQSHIQNAITLGYVDYADQLIIKHLSYLKSPIPLRRKLQLYNVIGKLFIATERWKDALQMYEYILTHCTKIPYHLDLLMLCMHQIDIIYQNIQGDKSYAFHPKLEEKRRRLLQYFNQSTYVYEETPIIQRNEFIRFREDADALLREQTGIGYTLIIIDFLYSLQNSICIERFEHDLITIAHQIFQHKVMNYCRVSVNSFAFVIQLSQKDVEKVEHAFKQMIMEKVFNSSGQQIQTYIGYINNVENGLVGYDACLNVVKAYVYYALYK